MNRIHTVTDPNGGVYIYRYTPNGQPERLEYPNGVVTTWDYDSQNRLEDLVTRNGTEVFQSYHYTMAKTGHRTQIDEPDGTVRSYQYDDLWRLTQDKVRQGSDLVYQEDFRYDSVGNRKRSDLVQRGEPMVSHVYTYDSRDRISSVDGELWSWDAGGRLLFQPGLEEEPDRDFQWWIDDRLVSVALTDGTTVQTHYDVSGNRLSSTESVAGETETVGYLVDDSGWLSHVVADVDGSADPIYVRGGDQLLGLTREGSENLYYHLDGLGSIRELSDGSGGSVESLDYSAFGRRFGESSQAYGFTGEPWSPVSLAYHRARWLRPDVGRFVSVDPSPGRPRTPLTLGDYLYVEADPSNLTDPTGWESLLQQNFVSAVRGALNISLGSRLLAIQNVVLSNVARGTVFYLNHHARLELFAGVSTLAAMFLDLGIRAVLNNTEAVPVGPEEPGNFFERKMQANSTGYRDIDDFTDGVGTSLKTRNLTHDRLLKRIESDAAHLARLQRFKPKKQHRGELPIIDGSRIRGRVLVVAVPETQLRFVVSPSFIRTIRGIEQANRVLIRVVPLRGWRGKK